MGQMVPVDELDHFFGGKVVVVVGDPFFIKRSLQLDVEKHIGATETELEQGLESGDALATTQVYPCLQLLLGPLEDMLVLEPILVQLAVIPAMEHHEDIVFA